MSEESKKTGIKKEFYVSEELRKIIGTNKGEKITRPQVVKRLWEYVKDNNLQDPKNKQWFTPDKTMAPVFGTKKIKAFSMSKYLEDHLYLEEDEDADDEAEATNEADGIGNVAEKVEGYESQEVAVAGVVTDEDDNNWCVIM